MEKLRGFLDKRPAIRLHYEHEGSFADWSRHFLTRMPLGNPGRLTDLILKQATAQNRPDIDPLLLEAQLKRYPLISTADHAGLLNYGISYNANLLMSGLLDQEALPYQLLIPTGSIPLNNASHPRGFFFDGQRFNLFPARLSHVPVCLIDEAVPVSVAGCLSEVLGKDALKPLDGQKRDFLECLLFDHLGFKDPSRSHLRFDEVLAHLNARLWDVHFAEGQRAGIPRLIWLAREPIIIGLLQQDLADSGSLVGRVLFDAKVRDIYLEEFAGLSGCWDGSVGTQFFWGVTARRGLYALRVSADGSSLEPVSGGQEAAFPLVPGAIAAALEDRRLIPSLFMNMFLLAFVEGYTLLGGFNQVDYLAWMRVQHERCLLRLGEWPLAARFARTPTDGLICGPMPFPRWASSLDMIWHHNSTNGRFNNNLDGGLIRPDLDGMMTTSMKRLIENGVDAMLNVIE